MKFSDYFFAPGVRVISTVIGVILGALTAIFAGWQYGVLVGAVAAVLLSVIIPVFLYREEVPYTRIKETLAKPFLFDRRVRFTVRDGSVGGYFILTQNSMVFLSLEGGNHRLELAREDVKSIIFDEKSGISIFLNNTQFIRVLAPGCEEMYQILRDNGWGI